MGLPGSDSTGDPRAEADFGDLYRHGYARLCGQLYAYLSDAAEAEDVVQEAFLRAWHRWESVRRYDDPYAWVRRVAWNLGTSRLRRLTVRARHAARQRPAQPVAAVGPEHVALVAALRKLPANHRRAIVLHHLNDQPVGEIAAELGVARGTVLSWLHRGRARPVEHFTESEIPRATAREDMRWLT